MPGEKMPECMIFSAIASIRTKTIVKSIKVRVQMLSE
jgi:hypothetical protein